MINEWQCWKNWKKVCDLEHSERSIVFYSESHSYWTHYESMIEILTSQYQQKICYLTSQKDDPILEKNIPNLKAFWIGESFVRTWVFRNLKADVMVLTVPDLETYYLKRSISPVHYVYVFHSLVSTHRVYNHAAFDHYDSILCCGPHHINEIKQAEKIYSLKSKKLIEHGYGRLDNIIVQENNEQKILKTQKILVAPSWGKDNIIANCGLELVLHLLEAGYEVILRPHPQSCKYQKNELQKIIKSCQSFKTFTYEDDMNSCTSLYESALMISDWSGAALDYAFGLLKPVLFIDVPPKINNVQHQKFNMAAIEDTLRFEMGEVLAVEQIQQAKNVVQRMIKNKTQYQQALKLLREKNVFHLGKSGLKGAEYICNLAKKQ